jgi:molecular chaperone HtpG
MTVQTHNFEADTGKILNIVINSLYSDRDIFLRELLSNASDAIHKKSFSPRHNHNSLMMQKTRFAFI